MSQTLTPEMVLHGYTIGVFPMADADGSIWWYSPEPRAIFDLDRFRVPRSLRSALRGKFEVRIDTAFPEVIAACADREEGTWISSEIVRVYTRLYEQGYAHSVETWRDGRLAGGLYGVALRGVFCGESMFHRVRDASKVALVALVRRMRQRGMTLLDTQWITPHLARFGASEVSREEYQQRLAAALEQRVSFADIEPSDGGPTARGPGC